MGELNLNFSKNQDGRDKASVDEGLLQALDLLNTNVFYCSKDLVINYLNDKSKQTLSTITNQIQSSFGFGHDKVLGQHLDVFHGSRAQEIRSILGNRSNFPYRAEITFSGLILDLSINFCSDKSGEIAGYVVNWEEISEKHKAESEMATAQQMVELSPVNTMMSTPEGDLTYINRNSVTTLNQLRELLPCAAEELVGRSIDILHKNPEMQRKIIGNPSNLPHNAVIQLGPEYLDLLISPIYDNSNNYMGPMVTWEVITNKVTLVKDLTDTANNLNNSAEELVNVSSTLSAGAEETSSQANTVSTASEEVNAGVQTVATNMEEMVASIKDITRSTNSSSSMSNEAMKLAQKANSIINQLGESSLDIGNVIKVISSIAQQTNLLALNATIEAARAGDAGRGFAVVANEVKELAKQTATATSEITAKIETIQGDSKSAVNAIGDITKSIEELNGIANNVAASIEEQAASTNEVTRVVSEAATGVRQINENISQVSEAAEHTGQGANKAKDAAGGLKTMAIKLNDLVTKFKG
jgi:methyl-accepting chemotaxis protein